MGIILASVAALPVAASAQTYMLGYTEQNQARRLVGQLTVARACGFQAQFTAEEAGVLEWARTHRSGRDENSLTYDKIYAAKVAKITREMEKNPAAKAWTCDLTKTNLAQFAAEVRRTFRSMLYHHGRCGAHKDASIC